MSTVRHDWTLDEISDVFDRPFHDLLHHAHTTHREHFDANLIEGAMLLSIKTGACPEDCAYCPQAARYNTESRSPNRCCRSARSSMLRSWPKRAGATRFCMGAAWRSPNDRQVDQVAEAIAAVNELGLETCVTLGMLTGDQAMRLADAGLDYYNHNLDTVARVLREIITTRTYDDRLETFAAVRARRHQGVLRRHRGHGRNPSHTRWAAVHQLASLDPHPESVPINLLVQVPGTPLFGTATLDGFELVRTIAAARIIMPASVVRLSAGRTEMTDELQALCLHAGANSIFLGDKLLTTANAGEDHDHDLLQRLDIAIAKVPITAS